jgi:hypothetical protein
MSFKQPQFIPTKKYTFEELRFMQLASGLRGGAMFGSDYTVKQRAAGANMTVDVAEGTFGVRNNANIFQGLYLVSKLGTDNVGPFATSDATNPRCDQVILVQNDSSVIGTSDEPEILIIKGTASAGCQIGSVNGGNYRAGAVSDAEITAAHPAWQRLADVLVSAKVTKIETAAIVDRRQHGIPYVVHAEHNAIASTASTTMVGAGSAFAFEMFGWAYVSFYSIVSQVSGSSGWATYGIFLNGAGVNTWLNLGTLPAGYNGELYFRYPLNSSGLMTLTPGFAAPSGGSVSLDGFIVDVELLPGTAAIALAI